MLVAAACAHAEVRFAGAVQSSTVNSTARYVDYQLAHGSVARIEIVAQDIVRVRFNPAGALTNRLSGAIAKSGISLPTPFFYDQPDATYIVTDSMSVIVGKNPFRVVVYHKDGSLAVADAGNSCLGWDSETGAVFNRKYAPPDERYFGFGERAGPLDRRGRKLLMMNVDRAAYQEFSDPLYISIPFYYGMQNGKTYGVFLDNPAIPFFDVDSQYQGTLTFGALEGELDYYVMTGPEPSRVVASYHKLTGFMPLPPKWTLGFHQSRFGYGSQQQLLDIATTFRNLQIPCDALWLDLDYHDKLQIMSWDPANFPAPVEMNQTLKANGFRSVNIVDPVVHTFDRVYPYMAASKFFIGDKDGRPLVNEIFYGQVSWIDFTKDSTRDWYKEVFKIFLSTGVDGVWNDLNEPAQNYMPEAVYDFNGERRTETQARNLYALNITSLTYETMRELRPNVRPWIFSRSGYSGIHRYAANWSGDALTDFENLRIAVQMSNSMGLSGQNQFGHDIGGFLGSPSAELFIRWMQFASYIPIFRNHAMNTSLPREPWQFGEPYTSMSREIVNNRYRMLPYIYSLVEQASREGSPVLAPTFFHFPSDARTYTQDTEFMLGPSVLVAPVFVEGGVTRSLYLPSGSNWIDFNNGTTYSGGQTITVAAPLDVIPVFIREGAIIPAGPVLQHVGDPAAPRMTANVYGGANSEFVLYEDDGESFGYTRGAYLRTRLSKTVNSTGQTFVIERTGGGWTPPARPWFVRFHAVGSAPSSVALNGASLRRAASEAELDGAAAGWFYHEEEKRLIVRIADAAAAQTLSVQN